MCKAGAEVLWDPAGKLPSGLSPCVREESGGTDIPEGAFYSSRLQGGWLPMGRGRTGCSDVQIGPQRQAGGLYSLGSHRLREGRAQRRFGDSSVGRGEASQE